MRCKEYYNIRHLVNDGDIIAYRGNGVLSKSIQYFDKAYYNHVGVVKKVGKRLFTIDMWYQGIEIVPLSRRINNYQHFCIIRPKNKTKEEIDLALEGVTDLIERDSKYDYFLLPRIAFYKKTGIDLVNVGKRERFVCSELMQIYSEKININCYKDIDLITPQDFIRHANEEEIEIFYDYSPKINN